MSNIDQTRQHLNEMKNEELVSILRAHDESQWQPEVFDLARAILNERGIAPSNLVREKAGAPASDPPEDFNLVTLASYTSYIDAETDRLALETKGLQSWILDELSPLAEGMIPGIRLQVRAEDAAAATEMLESAPIPSSDLPDDIAEPPCPKCGSRTVMERAEVLEPSPALPHAAATQAWIYSCSSCGHKWPEP